MTFTFLETVLMSIIAGLTPFTAIGFLVAKYYVKYKTMIFDFQSKKDLSI